MTSTLFMLDGIDKIEVRVSEEENPRRGKRVLILHHHHGLMTQVLNYRGFWVDLTGRRALDPSDGLFVPLEVETDPPRFAHLLRSWLAGFDRSMPVGAAVWKWFEDQTRAYIVHPQAVQTQVMLQSFLRQLDGEFEAASGLNDLLKSGVNDLTVIGPKP